MRDSGIRRPTTGDVTQEQFTKHLYIYILDSKQSNILFIFLIRYWLPMSSFLFYAISP